MLNVMMLKDIGDRGILPYPAYRGMIGLPLNFAMATRVLYKLPTCRNLLVNKRSSAPRRIGVGSPYTTFCVVNDPSAMHIEIFIIFTSNFYVFGDLLVYNRCKVY